jgi:hypothetical protein
MTEHVHDDCVPIGDLVAEGLTRRQADHWTRKGYLRACPRPPGATSGTPLHWAPDERIIARATLRLCRAGLHVHTAAALAREHLDSGSLTFRLDPAVALVISPDLWAPRPDPSLLTLHAT